MEIKKDENGNVIEPTAAEVMAECEEKAEESFAFLIKNMRVLIIQ